MRAFLLNERRLRRSAARHTQSLYTAYTSVTATMALMISATLATLKAQMRQRCICRNASGDIGLIGISGRTSKQLYVLRRMTYNCFWIGYIRVISAIRHSPLYRAHFMVHPQPPSLTR